MARTNWTCERIHEETMQHAVDMPCQDAYAWKLASLLSMHVHRNELIDEGAAPDDLPRVSAIVVAPTGQGKTYLLKKMTESMGLNLITIDCSTLTAEGWRGISLANRLAAAKQEAKDRTSFERSVLFFDELDKLRLWGTHYDQGSAMPNLLQLFNNGSIAIGDGRSMENLSTARFAVLFGGAFEGLDRIIQRRIGLRLDKDELMQQVTFDDLSQYGIMLELLGRIGSLLTILPMQVEDYRRLIAADSGGIRRRYHNYLMGFFGVSLHFTDAGVEAIARECAKSVTGARAAEPLVQSLVCTAITLVEVNDRICSVILDADGHGNCCVRYEYGERAPVSTHEVLKPLDPKDEEASLPWVCIHAKNESALVQKLCRYYKNADGTMEHLDTLTAFLNCCVIFLHRYCRPSEFTFRSLEQLAGAVGQGGDSAFDRVMKGGSMELFRAHQKFANLCHAWTKHELLSALELIKTYIMVHNRVGRIRFEVKNNR